MASDLPYGWDRSKDGKNLFLIDSPDIFITLYEGSFWLHRGPGGDSVPYANLAYAANDGSQFYFDRERFLRGAKKL